MDLFDMPVAAARGSDPVSSHIAEAEMQPRLSKKRRLVYDALKGNPWVTARELSSACGLDHPTTHKRLPELEKAGFAERRMNPMTGDHYMRRCRVTGKKCCVWMATEPAKEGECIRNPK